MTNNATSDVHTYEDNDEVHAKMQRALTAVSDEARQQARRNSVLTRQ